MRKPLAICKSTLSLFKVKGEGVAGIMEENLQNSRFVTDLLRRDLGCDKGIWFAKWVNLSSEVSLWVMYWALFKLVFLFLFSQTLGPPNPMDIPDHFQVSFFPQMALLFTVCSSSFWYQSHCAPIFTDPQIVQAAFNNRSASIERLLGPCRATCCAWALKRNIRASLSQAENGDRAISVLSTKSRWSF